MAKKSKVTKFDANDPEMLEAYARARATFRYMWRELSWENRRIIPALDFACIKAPFSDAEPDDESDDPQVEHMWINELGFDGEIITGTLMNQPNWLQDYNEGDSVEIPLKEISDWMYSSMGDPYGGHTVQVMRSRMKKAELKKHDEMWGLDFGEPGVVQIEDPEDHPMSVNTVESFRESVRENPELIHDVDENGWTFLHSDSLAGNLPTIKVYLKAGADPLLKDVNGRTPITLARLLGWDRVVAELNKAAKK